MYDVGGYDIYEKYSSVYLLELQLLICQRRQSKVKLAGEKEDRICVLTS
jgi:hypothetical protein